MAAADEPVAEEVAGLEAQLAAIKLGAPPTGHARSDSRNNRRSWQAQTAAPANGLHPKQINKRLSRARGADELLRLYGQHSPSMNDINLATCWSGLGRARGADRAWLLGDGDGERLWGLRGQTVQRLPTFSSVQGLANIAHAVGKLRPSGSGWVIMWNELERAALERAMELKPQELTNTLWAFATAGHAAPQLFDALAALAAEGASTFNAQDLANAAWSLATASHEAPRLFDSICAEAAPRLSEFTAQNLANTAWAFATAGRGASTLFHAIAAEAIPRLNEFNTQEIANLAWAYAEIGVAAPMLFHALAARAAAVMRHFSEQGLANTLWAFATAGVAAPQLFDMLAAEATARLSEFSSQKSEFTSQNMANIVWALATAGHRAPRLFHTLAGEAARRLREFRAQGIANTAWAFATAAVPAPQLFDAMAAEAAPRLHDFNAQNLANMAWAFAKAGNPAPLLFEALAAEAPAHIHEFSGQGLANTAWALATVGHSSPALLDAIASEAASRMGGLNSQDLANLAWAYAAADHLAPALFGGPAFVVSLCNCCSGLVMEELSQLHQWQVWLRERGVDWPQLPLPLTQRCCEAFHGLEVTPSRLQSDVASTLRSLYLSPMEEVRTMDQISLDAVVTYRGHYVAVEVDGPWHFFGQRPTGATALKRRQLRSTGWPLVSVPFWEWDRLDGIHAKCEYLHWKLEAALYEYS